MTGTGGGGGGGERKRFLTIIFKNSADKNPEIFIPTSADPEKI